MFTAALFTTEKTRKQPKLKRPSTGMDEEDVAQYAMEYRVRALGCA